MEQLQEASVMILRFEGQRDKHVTHTGNKLELGLPLPGGSIRWLTLAHSFISTSYRREVFVLHGGHVDPETGNVIGFFSTLIREGWNIMQITRKLFLHPVEFLKLRDSV